MAIELPELRGKVTIDTTSIDRAGAKAQTAGKSIGKAGIAIGTAAGAVAAGLIEKAAGAVTDFASKSIGAYQSVGTEVLKLQRVLGGTAEEQSRLRFASQQSGVTTDKLRMGMKTFSKEVAGGGKALKNLGVKVKDTNGKLRPTNDILLDLAGRFEKMPNGAEKTATAVQLFGRAGMDMLPFLGKGKVGLEKLMASADEFGQVLTEKDTKAVKDQIVAQRRWQAALQGAQMVIGRALLPVMSRMTEAFVTLAQKARPVIEAIVGGIQDIVGAIAPLAQPLFNGLQAGFENAKKGVEDFFGATKKGGDDSLSSFDKIKVNANRLGGQLRDTATSVQQSFQFAFAGLENNGTIATAKQNFATLGTSIKDVFNGLAPSAESNFEEVNGLITSYVDMYAGTIANIFTNWTNTFSAMSKSGELTRIKDALVGFGENFATVFKNVSTIFQTAIFPVIGAVAGFIGGVLVPAIGRIVLAVGATLLPILGNLAAFVSARIVPVFQAIAGVITTYVVPALTTIVNAIVNNLAPPLTRIIGILATVASFFIKLAVTVLTAVLPPIIRFAGPILGFLLRALGFVIRAIGNTLTFILDLGQKFKDVGPKVKEIWNAVKLWFGKAVDKIKGLPSEVLTALGNLGSTLFESGKNLVQGLLDGAGSVLSKVGSFFVDKLPAFIREPFKKALGIESPSKVFAGYGVNIGEGLVQGLTATRSNVSRALTGLVAVPSLLPNQTLAPATAQRADGLASTSTTNISVTAYGQAASNPTELARAIAWNQRTRSVA